MVVRNFNVQRIFALPAEANPPLVIHADAVLAFAVVFQGFQVVAIRHPQVIQAPRLMQQEQFPPRHALDLLRQPPRRLNSRSVSLQATKAANVIPLATASKKQARYQIANGTRSLPRGF
jgi:hypothetical protein